MRITATPPTNGGIVPPWLTTPITIQPWPLPKPGHGATIQPWPLPHKG